MSSALVREALALVDPEENLVRKRGGRSRRQRGQERTISFKTKSSKELNKSKNQITEENIKKLLALSKPTAEPSVAEKIVERAITQKPLADKSQVKVDEYKSVLFPETESFQDFESELFCS